MTDDSSMESASVQAAAQPLVTSLSAGAMIRQAREATGLHIAALSVSLKVSVKKLEALEADRLDTIHDAVFVRALASSVCRNLRIDPVPVLAKLPQTVKPSLQPEAAINTPFQAPGDAQATTLREMLFHPLSLLVAGLLVAAAVLMFWPEVKRQVIGWIPALSNLGQPAPDKLATVPAALPAPAPAAVAPAPGVEGPTNPASHVVVEDVARAPYSPASAAVATTSGEVPLVASTAAASPISGVADTVALQFSAKAQTWVEVAERSGRIAYKGMLQPGESAVANGIGPLAVTVGRADGVSVKVRGKPFDLAPVTKANVAHFEVN